MKVLLRIGYTDILLPDDKGIATVLQTLARGVIVSDETYQRPPKVRLEGNELTIQMKIVPGNTKYVQGKHGDEREVQLATPKQLRALKERLLLPS
jgi:hypothetical protein